MSVEPEPPNKSSTFSLGRDEYWIARTASSTSFSVKWKLDFWNAISMNWKKLSRSTYLVEMLIAVNVSMTRLQLQPPHSTNRHDAGGGRAGVSNRVVLGGHFRARGDTMLSRQK